MLATELNMPQMGYDMREGTVVRWLVAEGDEVRVGDVVAEIETDKAVVEFESTGAGVLRKILVPEGNVAGVGSTIAIVGTSDEEINAEPEISENEISDEPKAEDRAPNSVSKSLTDGEFRASPVAKRLASERGINLAEVTGTGPGGRITRKDILAYQPLDEIVDGVTTNRNLEPRGVSSDSESLTDIKVEAKQIPLSRMRQQIARVTVKSKQEIPHFYISADIDMTRSMDLRHQINADLEHNGVRVSVNDFIIKACVGALTKYPKFNAFFVDDAIQMNQAINIGIAIAEDEGLIVPAIMNCEGMSLTEIAVGSRDLIKRSKGGTLRAEEYTSGTFSISNLGMFDVTSFVAIIHPPQSAVLAVGKVSKRPDVRKNEVAISDVMTATLSVDHRVSDGAEGARFIGEVKRLLEHPTNLIV